MLSTLVEGVAADDKNDKIAASHTSVVMMALHALVVCTIHAPSRQIFKLFDSLLLLHKGALAHVNERAPANAIQTTHPSPWRLTSSHDDNITKH